MPNALWDSLRASAFMAACCKYTTFDATPGSVHNRVVDLVPEGSRVLEFGCATGYMSEVLKTRRRCSVTGIEVDPEAAELARAHCDRVFVGDADELDYDALLAGEQFDAILFADVLEHLRDPAAVLKAMHGFLAEDGVVIASIPNIAHGSVRLSLLGGHFRYRELGLLDDTHLRFFTYETTRDLFESSGYLITDLVRQRLDIEHAEIPVPPLPDGNRIKEWLAEDPEATTYQFIVRAVASNEAHQLSAMRDELRRARDEAEQLRGELANRTEKERDLETLKRTVDEQTAHIDALGKQVEALATRERELRELLLDAHDQLLRRDDEIQYANEDLQRKDDVLARLDREVRARDEELARLREYNVEREARMHELDERIRWMENTRAWRLANRWWRFKARVTGRRAVA